MTHSPSTRLVMLRALLHNAPPAAHIFQRALRLLTHDTPCSPLLTAYLLDHIQTWPDTITRSLPDRWLRAILKDPTLHTAPLFNTLSFAESHTPHIDRLASSPILHTIQNVIIEFDRFGPTPKDLHVLAHSPHWSTLHSLTLTGEHCARSAAFLFRTPMTRDLRHLTCTYTTPFSTESIRAFRDGHIPHTLHTLELYEVAEGRRAVDTLNTALQTLFTHIPLPALKTLHLEEIPIHPNTLRTLSTNPLTHSLQSLTLGTCSLSSEHLRPLLRDPVWPRLQNITLESNHIDDRFAKILAHATHISNLVSLDLDDNHITHPGVRTLGASPHLSTLESLNLCENPLDHSAFLSIATAPHFSNLTSLDIGQNKPLHTSKGRLTTPRSTRQTTLSDKSIHALTHSAHLPKLQTLDLCGHLCTERGFRLLGASPALPALRDLTLQNTNMGPRGAHAFFQTLPRSTLHTLNLSHNALQYKGIQALARCPNITSLHTLDLSHNTITRAGIKALFQSRYTHQLHTLDLSSNPLGDRSAKHIARASKIPTLKHLNVYNCALSTQGVHSLAHSPKLALKSLRVGRSGFIQPRPWTPQEIDDIAQHTSCRIW